MHTSSVLTLARYVAYKHWFVLVGSTAPVYSLAGVRAA